MKDTQNISESLHFSHVRTAIAYLFTMFLSLSFFDINMPLC